MQPPILAAQERIYDAERPFRGFARELWAYRELAFFLAWRDVKVRYRQTLLGLGWAMLRPVVSMAIFTFVFHRMAGIASGDVAYPLVVLAGVVGWNLVSEGVSAGSASLLGNTSLVTKVYFPRIVIPLSALARGLADVVPALCVFAVALAVYGGAPGWTLALLPVALLHALAVAFGLSLWFSALSVRYRDVAHALPFVLQTLFWISPVGYGAESVPAGVATLYWCNPLTGVIQLFRFALLGGAQLPPALYALSAAAGLCILLGGLWFFQTVEADFADVI
jgi:lipopolysaccharide transport system permease protein